MKNSVLVLGGGLLTVPMYEAIKKRGLQSVCVDEKVGPGAQMADLHLKANPKDIHQILGAIVGLDNIEAVTTCGADLDWQVAAVAKFLQFPGNDPSAAATCYNKALMRSRLRHWTGMRQPYWSPADRWITKPIVGCGSEGVRSGQTLCITEEKLEGTFHTIELLLFEGEAIFFNVVDSHFFDDYPFCECLLTSSVLDAKTQHELLTATQHLARTIGINDGPFKADICLTKDGPYLIECTARLSGGFHCQYITPVADGYDIVGATLAIALAEVPERPAAWLRKYAAVCTPRLPLGKIKSINLDAARACHGVDRIEFVNDGYIPVPRTSKDRRVWVLAHSENSVEEAVKWAKYAGSQIDIEVEPLCICGAEIRVERYSRDEPTSYTCPNCGPSHYWPKASVELMDRY